MSLSMFWALLVILASLYFHLPFTAASGLAGNETDQMALLSFKAKITSDPLQAMSSWNNSIHFCQWQGVRCSTKHQRVTALDLSSKQLVGSLSPHIGNMSFLKHLLLHDNAFYHEIPQELGRLFRLQALGLENNSFAGEIPANLSRCLELRHLGLDGNKLEGQIPMELGISLTRLEVLVLRLNNLTGKVPESLGNITSLKTLAATENKLEGSIPNTLGQLRSLSFLALGGNKLTGTIPPSVFNITSLFHIAAPVNQIQGSLPRDIGLTLPNLRFLFLHTNRLSGRIPLTISNGSNLQTISISRNQFSGAVPSLANVHGLRGLGAHINSLGNGEDDDLGFLTSLVNCTNLEAISLSDNHFGGRLPESMGNLSVKLRSIGLGRNQIVGNIPVGIGNLINLDVLSLEDNQLSGGIPSELGRLRKLKYLWLRGNKLSGEIPISFGNLTLLYGLNLAQNHLQGKIPSSLGNCSLLNVLELSHNELNGTIPRGVFGLSSLSILLDLSHNHLSGSLPTEVGHLVNLGHLDVSENKLSGEIPTSVGSCIKLENLYLQGNLFQGTIPSSLSSLRGMESLDLSRNNLTGKIPKFLENFAFLQSLNLSFNAFNGEVPVRGVFKNAPAVSIIGNTELCGGVPILQLPECGTQESKKGKLSFAMKLIISVLCGLVGLILVLALLLWCWVRNKREEFPSKPSFDHNSPYLNLSYDKLLKATNGFSSTNLIGVGAFGSVYKGILEQDSTPVAIKVLNLQHRGASKSFLAECEALRNLRHRNLVKIITVCSSVDSHGNDFKALVYEFMVNGSLEEWLHPIDKGLAKPRNLNFLQRLDIAIDIACALEYLHCGCETPIVHCDLKPSNVLIDSEMTAVLGDFGLARFPLETVHPSSEDQTSSLVVKGTIGYAAPENGMGSEVSVYGDMYSYGIIVLELFTGRRPTDDMLENGMNLHSYAKMALPERIMQIADPILLRTTEEGEGGGGGEVEEEEGEEASAIYSRSKRHHPRSSNLKKCLALLFTIGVACSVESPRERMEISDVLRELHLVKDLFVGQQRANRSKKF